MNELIKLNKDNTISSMDLVTIINEFRKAECEDYAELQHKDFLKKIRKELETLEFLGLKGEGKISPSSYINSQNKEQPCYKLTRDGMLQMLNSESAFVRYKTIEYINKLENEVVQTPKKLTALQQLKLQSDALLEVSEKQQQLEEKVEDMESNFPLFNIECEELQKLVKKVGTNALGGYGTKAYKDNSLRQKVYKDIQHQLTREFGIGSYKAIKRCQLSLAKEIVQAYRIPTFLQDQVTALNNQIEMEEI